MNLLSTNNSFYRYKIENNTDISESTYLKRLTKSAQNNKKSFFYEINCLENMQSIADFIRNKIKPLDCVLTTPEHYQLFSNVIKREQCIIKIRNQKDLTLLLKEPRQLNILFTPNTKTDLKIFVDFQKRNEEKFSIFWSFTPYNQHIKNSITVKDINKQKINFKTIFGLEIYNSNIPAHYELEPLTNTSYKTSWNFSLNNPQPTISVIIPTYNNVKFLSNVIWHLINQKSPKDTYEIIIADDGSLDNSSEIIYSLFEKYQNKINIRYIYWSKMHPKRGEQQFFRSGLARNLAARYSNGKYLLFLDSDMLVPENFICNCISELQHNDIIQFQRFHINQELSQLNPHYKSVDINKNTYIEETRYWSELFFCKNWADLPNYWKYTCTYALGIAKDRFFELGMFKKYYISYGFEDTDLGYEAYKRNFKSQLIKTPLLHLTAYDKMQYRNSFTKRFQLLRITAELFYLQHLDTNIYHLLGNYYRAQKPIKALLRDLIF